MKLSISHESAEVLRVFAQVLPLVVDRIVQDVERLYAVSQSCADSLGPHAQEFTEMLLSVRRQQQYLENEVLQLSEMAKSTADKIDDYLMHGATQANSVLVKAFDISGQYMAAADSRLQQTDRNSDARRFYEANQGKVRIADYDYMGTAFYNSLSCGICLNAVADLYDCRGSMTTYFHETGHCLDHLCGNGIKWLSDRKKFRDALSDDLNAYINKIVIEKHCNYDEACDIISDELEGNHCAEVSDIFGSLSSGRCQGSWGHHYTYWNEDPSRIEKEAFANMFESSIGDSSKIDLLQQYLPRSYKIFCEIIRGALNDSVDG